MAWLKAVSVIQSPRAEFYNRGIEQPFESSEVILGHTHQVGAQTYPVLQLSRSELPEVAEFVSHSNEMRRNPAKSTANVLDKQMIHIHHHLATYPHPIRTATFALLATCSNKSEIIKSNQIKSTANGWESSHKHCHPIPVETAGTRWATRSLDEIRDSHWSGIGCWWNTLPAAANQPVYYCKYKIRPPLRSGRLESKVQVPSKMCKSADAVNSTGCESINVIPTNGNING